jgi:hypothetical protein
VVDFTITASVSTIKNAPARFSIAAPAIPNNGYSEPMTVTITSSNGEDIFKTGLYGSTVSGTSGGVWSITGTRAECTAALEELTVINTAWLGTATCTLVVKNASDVTVGSGTLTVEVSQRRNISVTAPEFSQDPANVDLDVLGQATLDLGQYNNVNNENIRLTVYFADARPVGVADASFDTNFDFSFVNSPTAGGFAPSKTTDTGQKIIQLNAAGGAANYLMKKMKVDINQTVDMKGTAYITNGYDTVSKIFYIYPRVTNVQYVPATQTPAMAYRQRTNYALPDYTYFNGNTTGTHTVVAKVETPTAMTLSTGTYGSATSTYNSTTGVWSITGSKENVGTALNDLKLNVTNFPAVQGTSKYVKVYADSTSGTLLGTFNVAFSVPVFTVTNSTQTNNITYSTATNFPLQDFVCTVDRDSFTATLTVSHPSFATLSTPSSGTCTSTYNSGTGVWTATVTGANYADLDAVLDALTVTVTNYDYATAVTPITIATVFTDGLATINGTITLNISSAWTNSGTLNMSTQLGSSVFRADAGENMIAQSDGTTVMFSAGDASGLFNGRGKCLVMEKSGSTLSYVTSVAPNGSAAVVSDCFVGDASAVVVSDNGSSTGASLVFLKKNPTWGAVGSTLSYAFPSVNFSVSAYNTFAMVGNWLYDGGAYTDNGLVEFYKWNGTSFSLIGSPSQRNWSNAWVGRKTLMFYDATQSRYYGVYQWSSASSTPTVGWHTLTEATSTISGTPVTTQSLSGSITAMCFNSTRRRLFVKTDANIYVFKPNVAETGYQYVSTIANTITNARSMSSFGNLLHISGDGNGTYVINADDTLTAVTANSYGTMVGDALIACPTFGSNTIGIYTR